jgi:hypothetical protein
MKWADKTKPFVMWNEFKDVKYADMDLEKENLHFYFVGMEMARGTKIGWDDFWGSFHLYASLVDLSVHRLFTNIHWDNIPFEPCGYQSWAKALPDSDPMKEDILKGGICMNAKKIVKTKGARYKEVLPVNGGSVDGGIRIFLDWYDCMPGGASPTTGVPLICDNKWKHISLMLMAYEKTVNIKNYNTPIKYAHKEIDRVLPMKTLRYEATIYLKWVELYTDIGAITKNWIKDQIATIESFSRKTSEKSIANIPNNYLSQGKVIMSDMNYHLEIVTSNSKTEIYRYY